MPLASGSGQKIISKNISELRHSGYGEKQSIAIAESEARKSKDETAEAWISKKIEELINRGYEPKRAEAAAYAEHRRNAKDSVGGSAREYDLNGWPEIKGNPISKVGVFPYSGAQISPDLEPDRIYYVYRPEEELSNPETIDSFRLLPWTDEHAMLGDGEGLIPAENKGIQGVIGEDVYFADGYLKGNIKVFSESLAELIENGKRELSIGYRCEYDIESGIYNGVPYDAIQRNIRGNHLALVDEGRSGSDVAVLDHLKITFDSKDLKMPDMKRPADKAKDEEEMSMAEMSKMIKELSEKVHSLMKRGEDEEEEGKKELSEKAEKEGDGKDEGDPADFVKKYEIEDDDYEKKLNEQEEIEDESEEEKKKEMKDKHGKDLKPGDMEKPADKKGMDSKLVELSREVATLKKMGTKSLLKEISRRNLLAEKLSNHIGVFDHSEKTLSEVVHYGVKKLGLSCKPGFEEATLTGYLAGARVSPMAVMDSMDKKVASSDIDAYLKGSK